MYGTLAGALSGRKIPFDRQLYTATVDGGIAGIGKTIRIYSIAVHYDLNSPPAYREATERALKAHPSARPVARNVNDAIAVTWAETLDLGRDGGRVKSHE